MKYLHDYVQEAQTKLFEECGVFFAFSEKQLKEGCEKVGATVDNRVMSFGHGGYLLSKHYEKFEKGMEQIQKEGMAQDIAENGLEAIIERELANYETQLNGDWKQILEVLEDYEGVTEEMVLSSYKKYYQKCLDNNWF